MNLSKLYNNPNFKRALGGKQNFYQAVKNFDSKVTMKQIEKFLQTEQTYHLHEPFRKPKYYRKVFTKGINGKQIGYFRQILEDKQCIPLFLFRN